MWRGGEGACNQLNQSFPQCQGSGLWVWFLTLMFCLYFSRRGEFQGWHLKKGMVWELYWEEFGFWNMFENKHSIEFKLTDKVNWWPNKQQNGDKPVGLCFISCILCFNMTDSVIWHNLKWRLKAVKIKVYLKIKAIYSVPAVPNLYGVFFPWDMKMILLKKSLYIFIFYITHVYNSS